MAYTIEIADAVAKTVGKFASLNAYQLAGHIANLEFWQFQVKQALDAIDGYESRQRVREQAQREYIAAHDTRHFDRKSIEFHREFPDEPYHELRVMPDRHRIDKELLREKRRAVADAFYNFIRRSHGAGLLNRDSAKQVLSVCGIDIEPGHFIE